MGASGCPRNNTSGQLRSHSATLQLFSTGVMPWVPGAEAQFGHQGEMLHDHFPFPIDYADFANSPWALAAGAEALGATRALPGRHEASVGAKFSDGPVRGGDGPSLGVVVLEQKGHGGGANRSDRIRRAIDIGFSVGSVRQVENPFLSCPMEIDRTRLEELVSLRTYVDLADRGSSATVRSRSRRLEWRTGRNKSVC